MELKRRDFLLTSVLGSIGAAVAGLSAREPRSAVSDIGAQSGGAIRKILIAGGGFGTTYIKYMAELTGKARPKLCYLPTATGDSPSSIIAWFRNSAPLNVEPSVQEPESRCIDRLQAPSRDGRTRRDDAPQFPVHVPRVLRSANPRGQW